MNRAAALFLLGAAAIAVGTASALVAHENNRVADELARAVHRQNDLRVLIDASEERIAETTARLRREFDRDELPTRAERERMDADRDELEQLGEDAQ
ncbi:MAG: hypothetical protein R3F34_16860 [Planctomycetota bacterium]